MAPLPILPDHIIEEIFAFLPSKSVGRCRCLSRGWAAELSSDYFVRRHFHAANRGRLLLLGTADSTSHDDDGAPPTGVPPVLADVGALRMVAQQCRGLVILQAIDTRAYYVLNPSTGQTAALPACRYGMPSLGLGYDESTGEHKIVRIYGGGNWFRAGPDVYVPGDSTTGAGAFWRRISRPPPPPPSPEYREIDQEVPSVSVQGRIYWLGQRWIQGPFKETIIISYSISNETLDTMPAPHAIVDSFFWVSRHSLAEVGGDLCLFTPRLENGAVHKWQYNLWRLSTHGAAESSSAWELRCRIILPAAPAPEKRGWVNSLAWVVPFHAADEDRRILVVQSNTTMYHPMYVGIGGRRRAGSAKMFACKPLTEEMTEKLSRGDLLAEEMTEDLLQVNDFFLTGAALCQESLVSPPGLIM